MQTQDQHLQVRMAETDADVTAAQHLRYRVFVEELGGDGPLVNHDARLEIDPFDSHCQHLLLCDDTGGTDEVVGVYRLMTRAGAEQAGQFYTETEYDLSPLLTTNRKVLELGRSCLLEGYRGGTGMMRLWQGLAEFVEAEGIELLFGVASFHGTDIAALAEPLTLLHHRHLAPTELRVTSKAHQPMDLVPAAQIDRVRALRNTPALIKAYLRLGGFVGDGAFVDHAFNTTDICLVMDTERLSASHRAIYAKREG